MATIPSEMTAVAGTTLTALQWNTNVRDSINFLIAVPVCELEQTVSQTLTNNAHTQITFDTEVVDNDNMHSTSSNTTRMTCQTPGRYVITGSVTFASNATGRRLTSVFANGGEFTGVQLEFSAPVSGNSTQLPVRWRQIYLNAGDFIEIDAFQNSGAGLGTTVGTANYPTASARWIGTT